MNGPSCRYCYGEWNLPEDSYRTIQVRARADRKRANGGWQYPMMVGPSCFDYLRQGIPGDWRYAASDSCNDGYHNQCLRHSITHWCNCKCHRDTIDRGKQG